MALEWPLGAKIGIGSRTHVLVLMIYPLPSTLFPIAITMMMHYGNHTIARLTLIKILKLNEDSGLHPALSHNESYI